MKENNNRRDFLKKCGLSMVPFLLPTVGLNSMPLSEGQNKISTKTPINFLYDGLDLSPQKYIEILAEINQAKQIEPDFYEIGGATKLLEDKFAKLSGKEKAIYLPTGTMANQLAIKLLNGNNTKVIVPENSHVYRDEADAAQSVFGLRLIPVGKDKAYFQQEDVESAIQYYNENEVFRSGLGTVVIENPIRRADGTVVPIETIRDIANYCRKNGYKMHLDGARIHIASAYTNISFSEYASYFDTVYISLYKYLNATGGAILCGDAKIIDQIPHLIKIHGGTTFQSWSNTSVAMHYLDGITERFNKVVLTGNKLISELNEIDGISITSLKNGTNIYEFKLASEIDLKQLTSVLLEEHNILLRPANEKGIVKFTVNESLLTRDFQEIVNAWKTAIKKI